MQLTEIQADVNRNLESGTQPSLHLIISILLPLSYNRSHKQKSDRGERCPSPQKQDRSILKEHYN